MPYYMYEYNVITLLSEMKVESTVVLLNCCFQCADYTEVKELHQILSCNTCMKVQYVLSLQRNYLSILRKICIHALLHVII